MTGAKDLILLEGSEKTSFQYRIDGGMDERDKDEIEAMDSGYVLGRNWPSIVSDSVDLRHRMTYIRRRNLGFSFLAIPNNDFRDDLEKIDPCLPKTLAYMVADFYSDGTQRVSDLLENVTRKNPAGFQEVTVGKPYQKMFCRFLEQYCGKNMDEHLDDIFFERIPADKFGCASIDGNRINVYTMILVLQIVLKA